MLEQNVFLLHFMKEPRVSVTQRQWEHRSSSCAELSAAFSNRGRKKGTLSFVAFNDLSISKSRPATGRRKKKKKKKSVGPEQFLSNSGPVEWRCENSKLRIFFKTHVITNTFFFFSFFQLLTILDAVKIHSSRLCVCVCVCCK